MINRISFILLTAVLFTAFGCSQVDSENTDPSLVRREYINGDISVVVSYPRGPVLFGNRITIHLELSYPEKETCRVLPPGMSNSDSESTWNFQVYDIRIDAPLSDGKGRLYISAEFIIDPVLPGELVFPGLMIESSESILLEPISIEIKSAFENPDGSESPHQLSSIYIPGKSNLHIFIIAGAFLLGLILTLVLVQKYRRGRLAYSGDRPKTKEELLRDFGDRYFSFNSAVAGNDLKRAFGELQALIDIPGEHSDYFKKVRYSNEDVDLTYALSLLKDLYEAEIKIVYNSKTDNPRDLVSDDDELIVEDWTPEGGDE